MPMCKFCGLPFSWGHKDDGKWVPLVPVGEDADLDRSYQDEDGLLRAEHAIVCIRAGGKTVRVSKLARAVRASDVLPNKQWTKPDEDGVIEPIETIGG